MLQEVRQEETIRNRDRTEDGRDSVADRCNSQSCVVVVVVVVVVSSSPSSSSSALRSRSTSTGLLPLVSRPRSASAARSSTTFNFDGSIVRARSARLARYADSCTPAVGRERENPHERPIYTRHRTALRTQYGGSVANMSLRSARRAHWPAARRWRGDAARAANRARRLIRERARRARRLAGAKAGRAPIGWAARRSCEFQRDARWLLRLARDFPLVFIFLFFFYVRLALINFNVFFSQGFLRIFCSEYGERKRREKCALARGIFHVGFQLVVASLGSRRGSMVHARSIICVRMFIDFIDFLNNVKLYE